MTASIDPAGPASVRTPKVRRGEERKAGAAGRATRGPTAPHAGQHPQHADQCGKHREDERVDRVNGAPSAVERATELGECTFIAGSGAQHGSRRWRGRLAAYRVWRGSIERRQNERSGENVRGWGAQG